MDKFNKLFFNKLNIPKELLETKTFLVGENPSLWSATCPIATKVDDDLKIKTEIQKSTKLEEILNIIKVKQEHPVAYFMSEQTLSNLIKKVEYVPNNKKGNITYFGIPIYEDFRLKEGTVQGEFCSKKVSERLELIRILKSRD